MDDDDASPFDYLSFVSSISVCLTFSIIYVLALYVLSPSTRRYERNHSNVICRRFLAVFIICSLIYLFLKHTCNPYININIWLGFRINILSVWNLFFYPILLTLMLYIGPIIQWLVLFDWKYYKAYWKYYLSHWNTNEQLIFIRNYLVAPFTEEFVFRSSMLCVLYSHVSLFSAIFISPLFFGLAHFHHMLEHFNQNSHQSHNQRSSITILLIHLFQFSYTYIFGVYSSFLFIRTGHFIPSFIIHILCNSLGIPDIINLIDIQDRQIIKRNFLFAICYLIGLWLFSTNLFFLTQSKFYYVNDNSIINYRHWSM